MTRINTNVSSLNAQKTLAKSNAQLQQALTRLSTGLRINSGKDDPAGLIASEVLRADITSTQKAVTNSERANQMIATADSALGQISSLLNDIRGLVSEAANSGAMSAEQIAANQLQVDSSLEAIDRIAQTTQFQGKKLLDGNLDMITNGVSNTQLTDLQIEQATFGALSQIPVEISVVAQATKASLSYNQGAVASDTVLEVAGANGSQAFSFASGSTIDEIAAAINLVSDATGVSATVNTQATAGHVTVSSAGANNDMTLTAKSMGYDAGNVRLLFSKGVSTATTVDYTAAAGTDPATVNINLQTQAWTGASATNLDPDTALDSKTAAYNFDLDGGTHGVTITAANAGSAYHDINVELRKDGSLMGDSATAHWDAGNKTLTVYVNDNVTSSTSVASAITAEGTFTAATTGGAYANVRANAGVSFDPGYTLSQTADGIGGTNNGLDITALLGGAAFNNVDVQFVDGNGTEAGITADFVQASSVFHGTKANATVANMDNDVAFTAVAGGFYDGTKNTLNFQVVHNGAGGGITFAETYDAGTDSWTGTVTMTYDLAATTAAQLVAAVNGSNVTATNGSGFSVGEVLGAAVHNGTGVDNILAAASMGAAQQLGATAAATQLTATYTNAATDTIIFTAKAGSKFDGAAGNMVSLTIVHNVGDPVATTFNENTGEIAIVGDLTTVQTDEVRGMLSAMVTNQGTKMTDLFTIGGAGANALVAGDALSQQLLSGGVANKITVSTAGTGDINAVAGAGYNHEQIVYAHEARAAKVALNGFNASTNSALTLTAATAGSAYNNVMIEFVNGGDGATVAAVWSDAQYSSGVKTADAKLTITVDATGGVTTSFDTIRQAINTEGHFVATLDQSVDTTNDGSGTIVAGDVTSKFNTYNSGGDAGTLFVHVENGQTTAADVVAALGREGNERAAQLFSITNNGTSDGSGLIFTRDAGASAIGGVTRNNNSYANALASGVNGGGVVATGQSVIDAINATTGLKDLVNAALATGNTGLGVAAAFQEFAYYGSAVAGTGIQFLGKEGARDVRFVAAANQSLSIDVTTDPEVTAKSSATLSAYNDNASLTFRAVTAGSQYDDTVVRFRALDASAVNESVTYDAETSAAEAYIELDATSTGIGLRLTANEHTADYNGVSIFIQDDDAITTNDATVSYSAADKKLTVKVNAGTTTVDKIMEKINAEGTFDVELDYRRYNTAGATSTAIHANDVSATVEAGNTGTTGGHEGGVLTFNVINQDTALADQTTAQDIINLATSDDFVNKYFQVTAFGGSATGQIDARYDSNQAVTSGGVTSEGTLIVKLGTDANGLITTTAADLVALFEGSAEAAAAGISASLLQGSDGTGRLAATTSDLQFATTGEVWTDAKASGTVNAVHGINARYSVTAVTPGTAYDGVTIAYENDVSTVGEETAEYDSATKTIKVHVKMAGTGNTSTADDVIAAITRDLADKFTAARATGSDGTGEVASQDTLLTSGGQVDTGAPTGVAFLDNSDAAATGVEFNSTDYGSQQFVSIKARSGSFTVTNTAGEASERESGTDVNARVNGIQAVGKGLKAALNTASLDMTFSVAESITNGQTIQFSVTGGGAQFQLGPDVVSNQQARLGIASVSTATLGGSAGWLYELRSGGIKALDGDLLGGAAVVEDVITQITNLRGRLGAFQKTTLDTNIAALNDTLESLTSAESDIRDADFAAESAAMTRAQILVQSGLSVLSMANQNPQNVLSLLR